MQRLKPFLLAGAMALAPALPASAQEPSADTVVVIVNGTEITLGHMIALREGLAERYQSITDDVLFPSLLEQLIQQAALAEAAGDLTRKTLLRLDNERRALIASERVEEVAAEPLSEEAIQAAYDARFAGYEPEREYNASHILVATQEEAQALVDALADGADFAQLAIEHSTGPSGPNGGNLGWFKKGTMVPAFEEAVIALEAETVSAPVETRFGWHVIRLNDTRRTSAPGLEEVRGELTDELLRQKVRDAIDDAVEAAEVVRPDISGIDPSVLSDLSLIE